MARASSRPAGSTRRCLGRSRRALREPGVAHEVRNVEVIADRGDAVAVDGDRDQVRDRPVPRDSEDLVAVDDTWLDEPAGDALVVAEVAADLVAAALANTLGN